MSQDTTTPCTYKVKNSDSSCSYLIIPHVIGHETADITQWGLPRQPDQSFRGKAPARISSQVQFYESESGRTGFEDVKLSSYLGGFPLQRVLLMGS